MWTVDGRSLVPAEPAPVPATLSPDERALDLVPLLVDAGASVVVEHGVVTGEIDGLEVARVVVDERGPRVEVGVGRHDREAFGMLHGDLPASAALAKVIATVLEHRRPDGPDHPLKHLVPERWLRDRLVRSPELVGASMLERAEGPQPRTSVKESIPAVAVGVDPGGSLIVAVASVGIDLDLVPFAADARLGVQPNARLVLVVPERDAHPVTLALAAALVAPAEVVSLTGDWRAEGPQ